MSSQSPDEPRLPGQAVDVPVPPDLAEAFGYRGQARFVGFCWSPLGDELNYDDGRSAGSGASHAFLTYKRHKSVEPLLRGWNLGYSDAEAEHCLLLDRQRNRASIAPLAVARAFLKAQHPPARPLSAQEAETLRRQIEEAIAQGWQEVRVNPAEVQRLMQEQRQRVGRMVSFLDMCPTPPGRGRGRG
jgi:hypothetical protein